MFLVKKDCLIRIDAYVALHCGIKVTVPSCRRALQCRLAMRPTKNTRVCLIVLNDAHDVA